MILLLLAVVWAAFLLPPWLQNRGGGSLARTPRVGGRVYDQSTLDISRSSRIGQRAPELRTSFRDDAPDSIGARLAALMPASADDAARRRRDVLIVLAAATIVSLASLPVLGGLAVLASIVSLGSIGGYCYLVVRRAQLQAERDRKVRPLRSVEVERLAPVGVHQPLRRTAGG